MAMRLGVLASRMQSRVDACLERNDGDIEAATTSSGIGISFLFGRELATTMERASEQFDAARAEIERLREALRSIGVQSSPMLMWKIAREAIEEDALAAVREPPHD